MDEDSHGQAADHLTRAAKHYRKTEKAHEEARQDLKRAARQALAEGVKQSEVAKVTGWTREYLRRLRKDHHDSDRHDSE